MTRSRENAAAVPSQIRRRFFEYQLSSLGGYKVFSGGMRFQTWGSFPVKQ